MPRPPQRVQLHRALSKLGLASRNAAVEAIHAGRVRVNGIIQTTPLAWVSLGLDQIILEGAAESTVDRHHRHLAMHKPRGLVVTRNDELGRPTAHSLLPAVEPRVEAVGRLDADSEGLLLFTSDTVLASRLLEPGRGVAKIYSLVVRGLPSDKALAGVRNGVDLPTGRTLPCQVSLLRGGATTSSLELVLHEGKNRQARRMLAAVGHKVLRLKRLAVGPIVLGDLPPGTCRDLTEGEVMALRLAAGFKPPGLPASGQPGHRPGAPPANNPATRARNAAWRNARPDGGPPRG